MVALDIFPCGGETVTDALTLDAKLVPLWRAMAAHADTQIDATETNDSSNESPWQDVSCHHTEDVSSVARGTIVNVADVAVAEKVLSNHWSATPHVGNA